MKDWVIQQPTIDPPTNPCAGGRSPLALSCPQPSAEEAGLRVLFGVTGPDWLDTDAKTFAAADLNAKARKYFRVLSKSAQNLIAHIEPPAPNPLVAPLKMRVCLPGTSQCGYQDLCSLWAGRLAPLGYAVTCGPTGVTCTSGPLSGP